MSPYFICREASNSVLTFLSDIFDLAKSSKGEQFLSIRDSVIIPRGATITRVLVAALTGALPSSRLETVASTALLYSSYIVHIDIDTVMIS